eukprot:TRINITY_DN31810_c0_g1_i1.p1 TRINITY_DN31810_c0_g1~~TRINITY_DN31810_c0_g1_i1.p1  ORF type:complete len:164 (+),score=11.51 TRINITY_DN31810_c0_g1_i1:53-493(+)
MGSSFRFSKAGPEDADRITELTNLAFEVEAFFKTKPRTNVDGVKQMMEKPDSEFLLLLDSQDNLAGSIFITLNDDTPPNAYFGMLSIHPSQQGKGLGKMMVLEVEKRFRERGFTSLVITTVSVRPELQTYYGSEMWSIRPCSKRVS